MSEAFVSEIFCSVQGEGPFTGEKQIFVRLAGCPLRCDYCDTPDSLTVAGHSRLAVEDVLNEVRRLGRERSVRTVSITGGEPLSQPRFLEAFLPRLKSEGFRTYLETSGIHSDALEPLLRSIDVVAMDVKMPTAIGKPRWEDHRQFLALAAKKAFVKIVVTAATRIDEFQTAVELVAQAAPDAEFVIQPVTRQPQVEVPDPDQISAFFSAARARLRHVRVMPQQHKIWGAR